MDLLLNQLTIHPTAILETRLTAESARRFGVSVDFVAVHTDLAALPLSIAIDATYAATFFVSGDLNIEAKVTAPICAVEVLTEKGTHLDIYTHEAGKYVPADFKFEAALPGTLGCTAVAELGFHLLRELRATETDKLGVVVLVDVAWLEKNRIPPPNDGPLLDFIRTYGQVRIDLQENESECPHYEECMGQSGTLCDTKRMTCYEVKED